MMSVAQRLRQKLLDLAIRGKLVPQCAKDEPASELLARIRKTRCVGGRAFTPVVPLPITEDETPFDLPKGWVWCRLGEICDVFAGYPFDGKKYSKSGVRICGGLIIMPDRIKWDECKYWADSEGLEDYLLNVGDVVIALDRPWISSGTKIGIIQECDLPSLLIQRTACLRSSVLDSRYLVALLGGNLFQQFCDPTGTTVPHISHKDIESFPIPLPPHAEQKRIVEKLSKMLDVVATVADKETRLSHLRQKARAKILDLAIRGKLVKQKKGDEPADKLLKRIAAEKAKLIAAKKIKKAKPLPPITDDEKPFDLPRGWAWVRWGDLSESIQYGFNAPAKRCGRIKMVRITDIQNGRIAWQNVPYCDIAEADDQTYLLRKGDILFARTGGTVGKSYLVEDVPEKAVYAGYLIRTRCSFLLSSEYFKLFMESELYWAQLKEGTIATAQPNCNGRTLARMVVPLPPLVEQKRIVVKVKEMLAACDGMTCQTNLSI